MVCNLSNQRDWYYNAKYFHPLSMIVGKPWIWILEIRKLIYVNRKMLVIYMFLRKAFVFVKKVKITDPKYLLSDSISHQRLAKKTNRILDSWTMVTYLIFPFRLNRSLWNERRDEMDDDGPSYSSFIFHCKHESIIPLS